MTADLRKAEGLLFIGDPHLTSIRPGRRRDPDFGASVLQKIDEAVAVANSRNLISVLLGDVFAFPKEDDQSLITRMIRTLGRNWTYAISNTGNHDIKHTTLADGDSLRLLSVAGILRVVEQSGPVEEFLLGPSGRRVGLGMTPYGQQIPRSVEGLFPEAETVIWCTHHDLRFKDLYTKTEPLFEIAGCDVAVNGHIHLTKPEEKLGRTTWLNPGNITRLTVDEINHEPAVWAWTPGAGFERIPLPDPPDLFDLTGYNVPAAGAVETANAARVEASAFVEMLRTETAMEMGTSDDGSLLREEIEAKCERDKTPPAVRTIVLTLLDHAVARPA